MEWKRTLLQAETSIVANRWTHKELQERVKELENEVIRLRRVEEDLSVVYDALNSSVNGVIITNLGGEATYVNAAFLKMFEYTDKDEVLGKNAAVLFTSKEVEKFSDVGPIIDEAPGETEEFTAQRKDGSIFPVEVSFSDVTDHEGNVVGRMASFVDASERERAKQALRESEERYRRITETVTDYIYTVRIQDGRPVETIHGHACVAVTGHTAEDFRADPWLWIQMVHEKDRGAVEEQAAQVLTGIKAKPLEHRIIRKDGAVRWVRNTPVLSFDIQGGLLSYDGLIQDITDRKLAEEALRESEAKYGTLAENSLTGIYIDQDNTIVFANNQFAEIYRYSREEAVGIDSWRLVHPDDRELTNAIRAKRLSGKDAPSEYEARGVTKYGETIWVKRRNRLIEYRGRPAILGNIIDVTEQKRMEEELRKTNTELKAFVDIVSHDLKVPIIAIQGFSARLLKSCQGRLGERGERYVEQIKTTTHRMEALVSDLLELSKIGRIVPTFEDISSLEIVRNVASDLEDRLQEKGIGLILADDLPRIWCDRERIYQVFENLLVNAIKFMGDNDSPIIEVGYQGKGAFDQFYVRDNGIGIDPKHHRRIFEMFHRLKQLDDEGGTGLGLAIVERIVKNHGGKVWVESEKGQGATFHFTLPKHYDV